MPAESKIDYIEYQMPTYMLYGNKDVDDYENNKDGAGKLYEMEDDIDDYFDDINSKLYVSIDTMKIFFRL